LRQAICPPFGRRAFDAFGSIARIWIEQSPTGKSAANVEAALRTD
jgi:hypothetical protein